MAYSHIHTQAHRHPRAYSLLEAWSILHLSDQHPKASYGDTASHGYGDTPSHSYGDTTSYGHGDLYASPATWG